MVNKVDSESPEVLQVQVKPLQKVHLKTWYNKFGDFCTTLVKKVSDDTAFKCRLETTMRSKDGTEQISCSVGQEQEIQSLTVLEDEATACVFYKDKPDLVFVPLFYGQVQRVSICPDHDNNFKG